MGVLGPNMSRLVVARMAIIAIPAGSGNRSFDLGLDALVTPGKTAAIYRQAVDWARTTIKTMREMPDCPWSTDEEVAADLLRNLEKHKLI